MTSKLLKDILDASEQLTLLVAKNKTYQVIVARYVPKWYQIFKGDQQLRIVIGKNNKIELIKLEKGGT